MIATPENRAKFIDSLEMWLKTPAFEFIDGVDFDFEYPGGAGLDTDAGDPSVDGANYNAFIIETRQMFDRMKEETGRDLLLTMAIGVGPQKLNNWAQSAQISEIMPALDRLGLMSYDFSGSWETETWFNAALRAPEGSGQPANIVSAIEQLKSQHGLTEKDFSKVSVGVAPYGRGQANVQHASPEYLPGSPASGGTTSGTVENSVYSYFDLIDNYIGPDGRGINGWEVYNYPEYAASLLYNADKGEAISFTAPEDMQAIANYVKEAGFRGVFSWQIDDDNGELLETIHQTFGHPLGSPRVAEKPYIYAPDCGATAPKTISPGLIFSDAGNVYLGTGWPAACPNQGDAWEQNSWTVIGSIDDFTVLGALEHDGGAGDGNAWVPGQVYETAGTEVTHNGRIWTNGWWTNGEPGIDAACVEISNTPDAPETPVDTPDEDGCAV